MLRLRISLLLVIATFGMTNCLQYALGQIVVNDTTPGARDAAAIATVQKSFAALGGVTAIAEVQSLETTGQILMTGSQTPMSFQWMEVVSGSSFEFLRQTTAGGTTRVFASGHGNPGFGVAGSPATRLSQHMVVAAVPLEMPAVLLYVEFQDPTYAFTSIASSGTGQLIHIQITNNSNVFMQAIVQQDWYFDPNTLLPVRVEYNLPSANDALHSLRASCIYSNFATQQGVLYPTSIQAFEQGQAVSQVTISSTQPNVPIPASELNIPLVGQSTGGTN